MKRFDTDVQYLKYKVLREVSKNAFEGTLLESYNDIPKNIIPGPKPTTRCCVYKERAIVSERVKLAIGGDKTNPNVIEVIDIACDECPVAGFQVTDACRGCIAHRCVSACKKDAIVWDASITNTIGGGFMLVEDITPFDAHNDPGIDYSMDVNTDNCWFQKLPNAN